MKEKLERPAGKGRAAGTGQRAERAQGQLEEYPCTSTWAKKVSADRDTDAVWVRPSGGGASPAVGQMVNTSCVKNWMTALAKEREAAMQTAVKLQKRLVEEKLDVTMPGKRRQNREGLHPLERGA